MSKMGLEVSQILYENHLSRQIVFVDIVTKQQFELVIQYT